MLHTARENHNVTQQDIADAVGFTPNHISVIERGLGKASIATLLGYCKRLDMTPNEILGFDDDVIPPLRIIDENMLPELIDIIRQMNLEDQRKLLEIAKILIGY